MQLFGLKAKGPTVRQKSVRFQDEQNGNGSRGVVLLFNCMVSLDGGGVLSRRKSARNFKGEFQLSDAIEYVQDGIDVSYYYLKIMLTS